jgi:MoaA/NifB/PqqE/SkfB family radical SAM enzyme
MQGLFLRKEQTMGKRLSPSCFLRVFKKDGLVAVINQLRPEPIYLLEKNWRNIASDIIAGVQLNNKIASELVAHKLFINDSDIDRQMLKATRKQVLQSLNRPTILYLMMAQGCNFSCSYCPIPALAKQYGEQLLSFEDAVAGIMLWQKHIGEYPQDNNPYFLIFYGGEPLLNIEILERLLPYVADEQSAGRLPKKLKLMLCTNGSLIDDKLSKLFVRYKVIVAVGVDDSNPVFIDTEHVIRRLIDNRVNVVASVTITPKNIHRLAKYPDFLKSLGISQFGFNLMKGKALIQELAGGSVEDYCRAAAKGVLSGLANMTENGQCYEYQLEKKLVALQNSLPFSVDCTCYGNQLVVQADGQISNCPFLRFDQGHIRELPETFRIGQTEIVKRWRHRLPLLRDSIMTDNNNDVLDSGGCAWSSLELYGDTTARDINNATFSKEVTNELIWTLLPRKQANILRQGKISYWSYRRVGHMFTTRTGNL